MDDTTQLIDRLLTIAGMIMEDTVELTLVRSPAERCAERIRQVAEAGADITCLAEAAQIIRRRFIA